MRSVYRPPCLGRDGQVRPGVDDHPYFGEFWDAYMSEGEYEPWYDTYTDVYACAEHFIADLCDEEDLREMAAEIGALGGQVDETDDGLVIRPAPLHGGVFHTYADHRLATAAALLGLRVPGVLVEDVGTTAKTLPGFPARWPAMLDGGPSPAGGTRAG